MEDVNDDFVVCSVCTKEYDNEKRVPRVLLCLHSCCSSCLDDLTVKREVECPKCNTRHESSNESSTDFPVDSASRNFIDFLRVQRKPTEIPCTDCPDQDLAEAFCKECFVFMCGVCSSAHKRTQLTRKHAITSVDDLQDYGLDEFHRRDTCDKPGHEDQVYTFYCDRRGCDRPVCTLCAVCDHNQTNGHLIRNLTDVYEDSKSVVESVVRELNTKESPVTESIDILQRLLDDLEEKESEIVEEIDTTFNTLAQVVNDRRSQLHRELENQCISKKRDLQQKLHHLKSYAGNVQTANEFVSRAVSYTNPTEFLHLKNTILKRLLELKNLSFTAPTKEDVTLRFYQNFIEESFIQLVKNIGVVTSREKNPTTNNLPPSPPEKEITKQEEPEKLSRQFNTYAPSDRSAFQRQISQPSFTEKPVFPKQISAPNPVVDKPVYQKQASVPSPGEKPTYQRQTSVPLDHGLKDARQSVRDDIIATRQSRQQQLPPTPTVNGISGEIHPRDKSPSGRVGQVKPNGDLQRKLRPAPANIFKSDSKSSPMGLGDFLKDLECKGELPVRMGVDCEEEEKTTRPPMSEPGTPERSFKPITPTNPTSPGNKFNNTPKGALPTPKSPRNPHPSGAYPYGDKGALLGFHHQGSRTNVEGKELLRSIQTTPSSAVIFGDVVCPYFVFDVETIHTEREVSIDGKQLRNRKSGSPSGIPNSSKQLQKYKGIVGTFGFKEPGKYYYEVDVSFTIHQPLEETWLVFELGIGRADDIDKHHTVERHEHSRSCYVARYPEDGKLAQEFWHNRDLLTYVPLSDNTAGLTVDVTYGLVVDTKRRKWTVSDTKREKKLHTFTGIDFSEPLIPVFGTYNPDLVSVEMNIKTGSEITSFPAFLKGF
ncbi:transcription intermediary factor 1-alpha-like isoform X3 [Mizuhopecten yessoensis]|uniref:transcription intermediary factor 1-alpha-like isoform X3 n=1 Tax=Mizuhopecten yessoensis TaxID=6573 RepID=UPI000B458531|nr:transcription intermediary factor 1-alpha-like isoform X3 [Mizuhopecten yessoensis]